MVWRFAGLANEVVTRKGAPDGAGGQLLRDIEVARRLHGAFALVGDIGRAACLRLGEPFSQNSRDDHVGEPHRNEEGCPSESGELDGP